MQDDNPVIILNRDGAADVVLVCEHASNHIPSRYADLGLTAEVRQSHVAWDPGAAGVAEEMSRLLDAPLVMGGVSRLVYDCNRPPEAAGAMPGRSEIFDIPGNAALGDAARQERIDTVYAPSVTHLLRC